MWGFVLPYLFNPDKANLGAKVTFIFGALSVLSIVYLWYCQPESARLSYEKLDELFIGRVKARQFRGKKKERALPEEKRIDSSSSSSASASDEGIVSEMIVSEKKEVEEV